VLEQLVAREHPAGIGQEVVQELVLGGRELDPLARPPHVPGVLVQLQVGVGQAVLARTRARRPAQHGLHPLDELFDAEGLGDVVVAAQPQPLDLVLGGVAGGEEDDWHPRPRPLDLAQAAGHLEAVEVGKHDVEHHQVGPLALDGAEGVAPVGHSLHVEAVVGEAHGQQLGDVLLVVDHNDPRLAGGLGHALSLARSPWPIAQRNLGIS
jgi:hypothetical protein